MNKWILLIKSHCYEIIGWALFNLAEVRANSNNTEHTAARARRAQFAQLFVLLGLE